MLLHIQYYCLRWEQSSYDWAQVGGYRDLMLCLVYEGENGLRIIGEVQVGFEQPASMLIALSQ